MASFDPTTNDENLPKLGSLAQAARSNQLKGIRGILFTIGILNVVLNAVVLLGARGVVDGKLDKEAQELTKKGKVIDQAKLAKLKDSAVRATQLTAAGFIAAGLSFIVFGSLVYRFPVPMTVSALVIYLVLTAIIAALDRELLARGIVFRVIIVVALAKAIKSAIAYQRELQSAALEPADEQRAADARTGEQ